MSDAKALHWQAMLSGISKHGYGIAHVNLHISCSRIQPRYQVFTKVKVNNNLSQEPLKVSLKSVETIGYLECIGHQYKNVSCAVKNGWHLYKSYMILVKELNYATTTNNSSMVFLIILMSWPELAVWLFRAMPTRCSMNTLNSTYTTNK